MSKIPELAKKLITATTKGNSREIRQITDQITKIEKPHSFSEAWNYENKPPSTQETPGSFENTWKFTKKGTEV